MTSVSAYLLAKLRPAHSQPLCGLWSRISCAASGSYLLNCFSRVSLAPVEELRHYSNGPNTGNNNADTGQSDGDEGADKAKLKLVRDFIHDSLYNKKYGYFSTKADVVGVIPNPINFSELKDETEYKNLCEEHYKKGDVSWLTPVEIFKPWYGYGLGAYILAVHQNAACPLQIYEIGGGSGTCAISVMDFIKKTTPKVYETMRYTSVEISPALAERQLSRVKSESGHGRKFSVVKQSAADVAAWGGPSDEPCFIIMLEVLDNLPHDRVVMSTAGGPWQETWVDESLHRSPNQDKGVPLVGTEVLQPLQDPLIIRCMTAVGMLPPGTGPSEESPGRTSFPIGIRSRVRAFLERMLTREVVAWVPTGTMALMEVLHKVRPNMTLIIADFDFLPNVQLAGDRAPLVSSKKGGVNTDHDTYLGPKGSADIFFPTDFGVLHQLNLWCSRNAHGEERPDAAPTAVPEEREEMGNIGKAKEATERRASAMMKTELFMRYVADVEKTKVRSSYNPLLEDFRNTQVYISTPKWNVKV